MNTFVVLVCLIVGGVSLAWALSRFTGGALLRWVEKPVNYPVGMKWAGDPEVLILIIAVLVGTLWLGAQIKYG